MAAGLGFKTFTTGEVLTAADVNGYLMQGVLVFASEAARDAAITSPQEGQFAYTKDNNSLWYYTGSAWAASGATGDIEGVTAGTGISGGGTSGTVTITNSMATEITAKADLIVGTGNATFDNLAVGANGTVLTADSTVSPTGLKWAAPASGSTYVGAGVSKTTNQNITNTTWTACTFHSEDWDTDAFHDNSTNTSRLTVPAGKGGKYQITAQLSFVDNAIYGGILALYKNGSAIYGAGQDYIGMVAASQAFFFGSMTVDAAVNDYYELYVFHNSSGNGVIDTARLQFDYLGA